MSRLQRLQLRLQLLRPPLQALEAADVQLSLPHRILVLPVHRANPRIARVGWGGVLFFIENVGRNLSLHEEDIFRVRPLFRVRDVIAQARLHCRCAGRQKTNGTTLHFFLPFSS